MRYIKRQPNILERSNKDDIPLDFYVNYMMNKQLKELQELETNRKSIRKKSIC